MMEKIQDKRRAVRRRKLWLRNVRQWTGTTSTDWIQNFVETQLQKFKSLPGLIGFLVERRVVDDFLLFIGHSLAVQDDEKDRFHRYQTCSR
ncbi:unnamed protein product [Pieris macdunnoughi]|uniref:Uncharacterized protein n=1 Tax=Pieris macdunnoughi TaxID=345717 RepID=A0A821M9E2_9NEOP|nr:unnamed protein product [Pieris macdunnoughi]